MLIISRIQVENDNFKKNKFSKNNNKNEISLENDFNSTGDKEKKENLVEEENTKDEKVLTEVS